jgi:hypothetical protein
MFMICTFEEIGADTERKSYFALSYRWGDVHRPERPAEDMFTLSCPGSLLENGEHGVHLVVRDAIRLTRELGDVPVG